MSNRVSRRPFRRTCSGNQFNAPTTHHFLRKAETRLTNFQYRPRHTANHVFFFSRLFSRDKVSESCFTGQLPGIGTVFILASLQMCKVQRQSPLTNQREAAGVCWVWGELCEEVAEGWGLAIEIVMVGWVLEEEAGCKC